MNRLFRGIVNYIRLTLKGKNELPTSISDISTDREFNEIYQQCKDYTMSSLERMYALYSATYYVLNSGIEGEIVECGVWKGGSAMLISYILKRQGETNKKIYLYDTYSGMSEPGNRDRD